MQKVSELDLKQKNLIVKFYAEWCGPCKQLSPLVEKMATEFTEVAFVSVDIDEVPSLAQEYKIRSLPALVFIKNGIEVNRINGLVKTDPLRKAIKDNFVK